MRSVETELQNTIELRATASEIVAPKPDGSRRQSEKKTILKHFLKGFLEGKSLAPKTHFVRAFLQNSIGNSSTSTTCNPIYSEGTILQLQITMEFHRQLIHQHHLQSHLHCGNDPTVTQITMEFCRPQMHETQVKPHLQCGTDPRPIRP